MKNYKCKLKWGRMVFVLLFAASGVSAKSDAWESKKLFMSARSDTKKGLCLTAYDKLSEAYWLDPFNEVALSEMEKMSENYKKNLTKWGYYDFMQKSYAKGFLFYTRGDYAKALFEWEKILTLKENTEVRGYYDYVSSELKKGKKKDEMEFGGKAKKDRELEAKEKEQRKQRKKGKKEKKVQVERKPPPPKKQQPVIDNAKAEEFYNEGLKQYSQGYLKLAIASWEKALKYNPGHTRASRALPRAKKILQESKK